MPAVTASAVVFVCPIKVARCQAAPAVHKLVLETPPACLCKETFTPVWLCTYTLNA